MSIPVVDLRSDTVTKPTLEMRRAIAEAEVGDDVLGDDPTVHRLEERVCEILGTEAAVYMPSGSMTNQIAIRVHCKPGDEFLCESGCHIYNYEQAAFAQLSGVATRTIDGDQHLLRPEQVVGLVRPDNEHMVRTRAVTLENTHNRGGGRVLPLEHAAEICRWAAGNGLRRHLDGARLFNAVVATGISAREWASHFDTVSVCFSKGLGAPVGSALGGPAELIQEARRHRKAFGGAMRQAGIIAAGALYALDHHIERLAEDHANAALLARSVQEADHLRLAFDQVDTNIVIFHVSAQWGTAADLVTRLEQQGIRMLATGPQTVRAVTHLDVDEASIRHAAATLNKIVSEKPVLGV